MTRPDRPPRDQWVEHPLGRLFTRRWEPARTADPADPAAAPILMFHDSLGCVDLWRGLPADLCQATGRPVIAYDRLGFGRSDPREARPSLDFVAEEAAVFLPALREQLGLARYVALGHSVGGGMAIHAAAQPDGGCERLVTLAAQVFPEARTLEGIRAARDLFRDPAQVDRLARYHGEKTRWVLDAWIGNWLHPDFAAWTLDGVLPQVRCPALAIHGELDEYGSTVHPERIGRLAGGATRVEILPGVAHVPHREQPEAMVAMIAGFLGGTAQAGSAPQPAR